MESTSGERPVLGVVESPRQDRIDFYMKTLKKREMAELLADLKERPAPPGPARTPAQRSATP